MQKLKLHSEPDTLEEKLSFVSKLVISELVKTYKFFPFKAGIKDCFFPQETLVHSSFFPFFLSSPALPPGLCSSLLCLPPVVFFFFFNNNTREGKILWQGRIWVCVRLAVVFSLVLLFVFPLFGLFSYCADNFSM